MKKLLCIFMAIILMMSVFVGCSTSDSGDVDASGDGNATDSNDIDGSGTTEPEEVEELTSVVPLDTFMVGTPDMIGDFLSGFSNNTFDLAIRTLVSGYHSTYAQDTQGEYHLNETIVANVEMVTDDVGNKTYTFTLHDDLYWNNGDQITARDYVANVLWYSSPEWIATGASSSGYDGLVGNADYLEGTTKVYKGVQLIDELVFSVTVDAEELPYFWEIINSSVGPLHFDTYLPACEIVSTEEGSSLSFTEGDLASNCLRIAESERYAPTVTCGPYKFVSYENKTVTLELNEYFKGDANGNKPEFKYIIQKAIPQETNAQWVINGEVDYVKGIVEAEKIEAVKSSETAIYQSYPRSGYGFLAMLCDTGVTADLNVRWALASLIDRSAVVEYVLKGYGSTVDGEYGIGQWMYQDMAADLQDALKPISYNVDTANDYLDMTEWKFEADGTTAFDRTKATADGTYLRHNASGEVMTIDHLGMSDNVLTDIIEIQYMANAPLAGIKFTLTKSDWAAVLDNYYYAYELGEDRIYESFNLAVDFTPVFDRYYTWHSDFVGTWQNKSQLSDPELDELIIKMRETDPSDTEGYLEAWFDYQIRWNELMPQIPLYSNDYYDIAHEYVDGLNTTAYAGYQDIICEISKTVK